MVAKLRKVESKTKEFILFLPRRSKFAVKTAKLLKKVRKCAEKDKKFLLKGLEIWKRISNFALIK